MTAVEEQLRAEVIDLRERLADLIGAEDQVAMLRASMGLSPAEARVLALLLNTSRSLSAEAIYANVFERDNGDGPVLDSVKVNICRLRARMVAHGAPERCVPSAYSTGTYSLTPEARQWLSERLQVAA